MAEDKKIDDIEVVDEERDTKVVVVEAKEGIGMKVKKHWKKIAVAGAAVAAIAAIKIFGGKKTETDDAEFDEDFDSDIVDDPVVDTDVE